MSQPAPNSNKICSWEAALQNAITDPKELFALLELDEQYLPAAEKAAKLFSLKVPREFVTRIQKNNLSDPLLLQILPLAAEMQIHPDFSKDPLEESQYNPLPGLLHKYHGRVLLTLVGICGINCRFCFRKNFPYAENNPGTQGWDKVFEYIAKDKSISEVILSGGDPLVTPDKTLSAFTERLNLIPHIKRLRIHTRMPIVMPERINDSFIQWLTGLKQKCVIVVHCNHPQEINALVESSMQRLHASGAVLLNQTVLLKGVNDSAEILTTLSEKLFALHTQPYYLHVLDKVQGTAHFDMPETQAKSLHWALSQKLPGYLVPKLVYEQPGAPAKLALVP